MYIKNQWYLACLLDELNYQNPLKKKKPYCPGC